MSKMIEQLKQYLDTVSEEQFEKDWKEIEDMNLQGPCVDEYLAQLQFQHSADTRVSVSSFVIGRNDKTQTNNIYNTTSHYNLTMAA